jgi:hypothetical protein
MSDYWLHHKYYRLSVKDFVEEFCGWTALKELVNLAAPDRDRAFFSALFSTGGRVSEVLSLKAENFSIVEDEKLMIIRNMRLVKRYKKLSEYMDAEGHHRWTTELTPKTRKAFPILLGEPLAQIFYSYLQNKEGLLFPSPYIIDRPKPLSRFWAYKLVRWLDAVSSKDLRERLGLNKEFIKGNEHVADRIHLWLHWFRSQRASQLVSDYGYELLDLIDYFSWEKQDTALTYARKGWRGLASKMKSVRVPYV